MGNTGQLMWLDFLIISLMLIVSLAIGIYHACSRGKQRTTSEYLLGNRAMSIIPVTISLMVTKSSPLTLLRYPAEVYAHGSQWFEATAGCIVGSIGALYLFLPVLYPLKLTSVNEVINVYRKDISYILSCHGHYQQSWHLFGCMMYCVLVQALVIWQNIGTIQNIKLHSFLIYVI